MDFFNFLAFDTMNFTTLAFLPFLLIVIALYFTVFRKCQWMFLLFASVLFYMFSGPKYIIFVFISTLVAFIGALRIQSLHDFEKKTLAEKDFSKDAKKAFKKKLTSKRKHVLWVVFIVVIGLLAVIKYTNFALTSISSIFNLTNDWSDKFKFVLPLGISFYTFMLVGYILDVYWKRYAAEKNFFKLALFSVYFPHVIQGPIGRYDRLSVQFFADHPFDYDRVTKGFQLILWGYFEKMVISDRISIFTTSIFAKWHELTGFPILLGVSLFSVQLYLDWIGCMDIARGISEIFGINLDRNFWHPFFAKNMPEYWRRWHISLGNWFKDYLLYPVSMSGLCKSINRSTRKKWGNQASRAFSAVVPAAVVWIVTGVWHGAAACYVLWGIYHGILIILSALLEVPIQNLCKKLKINTECFSFNLFRMIRTFMLSTIGRIFFATAAGFGPFLEMLKRGFNLRYFNLHMLFDESLYSFGLDRNGFNLMVLLIFMIWGVGMLQEKFDKDKKTIRDVIAEQNLIFRWICYLALIAGIIVFGIYGSGYNAGAFFYGKF